MKIKTRDVALAALFTAICAVMTFVPFLGMIPLAFLSVNIVLIPILICAQTTNLVVAVIVSTFFGLFSMIRAYVNPAAAGIMYFAVQNPLVSVLPRCFIGIVANLSYRGLKKLFKSKAEDNSDQELSIGFGTRYKRNLLPSLISSILGVLTNTLLFLGALVIIYGGTELSQGSAIGLPWAIGIVATNFLPEAIVAAAIVPIVVSAIENALRK